MFVDARFQQFIDLVEPETATLPGDGALRWHSDTNKLVTFPVLTLPVLNQVR
jgi:hypothetical protein